MNGFMASSSEGCKLWAKLVLVLALVRKECRKSSCN